MDISSKQRSYINYLQHFYVMECFYFVYNSERNYCLNIEAFNHQTYNPKVMETNKFSFSNKKLMSQMIFLVFHFTLF